MTPETCLFIILLSCVCDGGHTRATVNMWWSEDDFQELVSPSTVGSRERPQVARLMRHALSSTKLAHGPQNFLIKKASPVWFGYYDTLGCFSAFPSSRREVSTGVSNMEFKKREWRGQVLTKLYKQERHRASFKLVAISTPKALVSLKSRMWNSERTAGSTHHRFCWQSLVLGPTWRPHCSLLLSYYSGRAEGLPLTVWPMGSQHCHLVLCIKHHGSTSPFW